MSVTIEDILENPYVPCPKCYRGDPRPPAEMCGVMKTQTGNLLWCENCDWTFDPQMYYTYLKAARKGCFE